MKEERSWVGDLAWYETRGLRELVRVIEDKGDTVVVAQGFAGCPILDTRNRLPKSDLTDIGPAEGWLELWRLDLHNVGLEGTEEEGQT